MTANSRLVLSISLLLIGFVILALAVSKDASWYVIMSALISVCSSIVAIVTALRGQ